MMKERTNIKPGDIILLKNYSLWTRIWYKLKRKELPYNNAFIVIWNNNIEIKSKLVKVLPLKKAYTMKEKSKLLETIELTKKSASVFPILYLDTTELRFVINSVRPDTLKTGTVNELLNSTYYKHI